MTATSPATKLAVAEDTFEAEVVEASRRAPVVVDFWASWCGPCRQLGPVLEGEVDALDGRVLLRTVDVDANPGLAQRFQVRGIPAVKGFRDGRVASEFVGALGRPEVRAFLAGLLPSEADQLAGRGDTSSLAQALELDPSHLPARRALARLLLSEGNFPAAQATARRAPQDRVCDGLAAWAELAQREPPPSGREQLLRALDANSWADALSLALDQVAGATGEDRDLLRRLAILCFEELGPDQPAATAGRLRLAAALY